MKREEVLQMKAGCKIDVLIAKHVMKFEWSYIDVPPYETRWINKSGDTFRIDELNYSTNIASAWQVVDMLCKPTGCDVIKVCNRDPYFGGDWSCNFGRGFVAFADTPSLAICRAALLVVMEV